jgi:ribosomal protein S18 acetylase RimI-like enzyme
VSTGASDGPDFTVHPAGVDDAAVIARLLHDFNTEFGDPTPGPSVLADRVRRLLAHGHITVLLIGRAPDGLAVLRFRPALWSDGLDCYLEELYVVPDRRGEGIGRALLEGAMTEARRNGAVHMDLGTSEDDVAARALYERLGFNNREGRADGPINFFYEREL